MLSAYSVTAISAARHEWRSRASTVITGMWSDSASALRTACGGMPWRSVEFVDRDQERQVARLEEVDRGEAVLQPSDVDQDDRADGAADQVVPHEPEPALAGRAEQVQHQILVEGDAAEVHRHRRGGLRRGRVEAVDALRGVGHQRLGPQRHDLGDRAHERRLAGAEPAGDDDLRRGGGPPRRRPSVEACRLSECPRPRSVLPISSRRSSLVAESPRVVCTRR